MSKSLTELLREADDAAPPPSPPGRLAETVRARSRARTTRRRIVAATALPLFVAATSVWLLRGVRPALDERSAHVATPSSVPFEPPVDSAALLADAGRLRADAVLRLTVVERLRERDERRRPTALRRDALASGGARGGLESEREKAALTLLDHADRLRRDLKQIDAALAAYRRTVELFPDTRWAAVARRRIEQLTPQAGPDARGVSSDPSLT